MNFIKLITSLLILYLGFGQITSAYANFHEEIVHPPIYPPPPVYSADAVVVMEAATGMILYSTNGGELKYPASITKIMTALVVLEHITDLEERILFSQRAIDDTPRHSSHIAMDVGETLTVYEALYALMLPSANEVSVALAEHVAGSVEEFAELMNRRALSLGAVDTYFANPSGLPGAGHVTTAYDMALIMREAIHHPLFVDVIRARRFDIPPTERQPEIRALLNTNLLIRDGPHFNPTVVGGKTGFTNAAGHTLVTYAQHDGRSLIVSVLGGGNPGKFTDTNALLDYGFAIPFTPTQVFHAPSNTPSVPVFQEVEGVRREIARVPLIAGNDIYFDLPDGFDHSQLRYSFSVPQGLAPPVEEGDVLGSVSIYVENYRIGNALLRATKSVTEYTPAPDAPAAAQAAEVDITLPTESEIYVPSYISPQPSNPPVWESEFFLTFAIPLVLSVTTLLISLIVYAAKRKNRMRRKLHTRYARYPHYYRYK